SGAREPSRQVCELALAQCHARQVAQDARAPSARHAVGARGGCAETGRIVGGQPREKEGVHALFPRRAV
ncbi:MAG: hypothetical protein GX608_11850, partial [Lentisphaerae bacterium]|nr:hypothetical protein [Lentisphaerota bacterium]